MAQTFDKIDSVEELVLEPPKVTTVSDEIQFGQTLLKARNTSCRPIKPVYVVNKLNEKSKDKDGKKASKPQYLYTHRFFCICPRYNPKYSCRHAGNVIIDRDVLTKEEHLCYLSTPRRNMGAPRMTPRYVHKRFIMPNCTSRIETLAMPDLKRVRGTLESYSHLLQMRQNRALEDILNGNKASDQTTIDQALTYIEEERRLARVARQMQKRRCMRMKKNIILKQRQQIKQIICVLFEEMKDFLLNDQFLIDEKSSLSAVILDQVRGFTDKDFYSTSNLQEYQKILANNLTVWINKFISNLNIHVAAPVPPKLLERDEPATFLPVQDYISLSGSQADEDDWSDYDDDVHAEEGEGEGYDYNWNLNVDKDTDATILEKTNP